MSAESADWIHIPGCDRFTSYSSINIRVTEKVQWILENCFLQICVNSVNICIYTHYWTTVFTILISLKSCTHISVHVLPSCKRRRTRGWGRLFWMNLQWPPGLDLLPVLPSILGLRASHKARTSSLKDAGDFSVQLNKPFRSPSPLGLDTAPQPSAFRVPRFPP